MEPVGGYHLRLLFWELTPGCNLRCQHCRAVAAPERSPHELTTDQARQFIDQLSSKFRPILILTGGEPLYRPDFFDIAGHAVSKGLPVAMATNGTLITPEIAQRVVDTGIRRVSISLDGAKAETHDGFRGIDGSYEQAIAGFKHLRERGMSMQINMTVARHNVEEIPVLYEKAIEMGADALHMFMLVPVGCGVQIQESQMLDAHHYEEVLNWFYDRSREGRIELKATCAPHYYRIIRQRAAAEGRRLEHKKDGMDAVTKGCLAGTAVCFVSHKGEVYPCGYLPVSAGNVLKIPFEKIWAEAQVFEHLRDAGQLSGKCGECEYIKVCAGCRARAFARTGDYLDEEPYCTYTPRVSRRIGS